MVLVHEMAHRDGSTLFDVLEVPIYVRLQEPGTYFYDGRREWLPGDRLRRAIEYIVQAHLVHFLVHKFDRVSFFLRECLNLVF